MKKLFAIFLVLTVLSTVACGDDKDDRKKSGKREIGEVSIELHGEWKEDTADNTEDAVLAARRNGDDRASLIIVSKFAENAGDLRKMLDDTGIDSSGLSDEELGKMTIDEVLDAVDMDYKDVAEFYVGQKLGSGIANRLVDYKNTKVDGYDAVKVSLSAAAGGSGVELTVYGIAEDYGVHAVIYTAGAVSYSDEFEDMMDTFKIN